MQQPAIDPDAYGAVKEAMGEIFIELIQTFQEYVPEQIGKLDEAIAQSNHEAVFNAAHAIKSSSGAIGALGLAGTAEQIEQQGRSQNSDALEQHFQLLKNQYQEATTFLQQDNAD